ncbi:hypothetical protein [Treponema pedis]|uniref:Uncharacterized protein n=1 Tax=Treponema pedis str. T A4 TaxID=1291379 RepID=S5ZMA0_9SPIR|nr:hypothetical protein [Treponema pedis]AGT43722.1 hypothetical protein TPE_1227 [Treponema pedis str. T A4]
MEGLLNPEKYFSSGLFTNCNTITDARSKANLSDKRQGRIDARLLINLM